MDQLSFVESFRTSPFILTEGAIVERLRHEFQIPLDKHIVHAALIYNDSYRETLAEIYRQYLQIAADFRLPLMLMTPTRRANMEQIRMYWQITYLSFPGSAPELPFRFTSAG